MENHNDNNRFEYTYSAKEQAELKRIREKYESRESASEDTMARLRRLDRGVTKKAQSLSLILGILGALVLGFGMSLIMTDLSDALTLSAGHAMAIGLIAGLIGALMVCLAYPVYAAVVKRERKKIAPEILRLTDELMK